MVKIQNSMKNYLNIIQQAKEFEQGKIFIKNEEQRYCYSFPYQSSDVQETEIHLRKAFLDASSAQYDVYPIFGAACSYSRYEREERIEYLDIRQYLDFPQDAKCIEVIPEGQYISIVFDEPASQKNKYYRIMKEYIEEKQLKVTGDFNETWLVPRLNLEQQESTLLKLDIRIDTTN